MSGEYKGSCFVSICHRNQSASSQWIVHIIIRINANFIHINVHTQYCILYHV